MNIFHVYISVFLPAKMREREKQGERNKERKIERETWREEEKDRHIYRNGRQTEIRTNIEDDQ